MDLTCAVCTKKIEGGLDSYVAMSGEKVVALLPTHEDCRIQLATVAFLESVAYEKKEDKHVRTE